MVTIPEIRVGESIVYGGMTVFPLFGGARCSDGDGTIDYVLAHEAMASGTLAVSEVSEAGSIHELRAENSGDSAVLFLEGEELRGAKQNRAVNASILVAARSNTVIPVICTESGRWGYLSRQFMSGMHLPPTLRRIIKEGAGANFTTRGRNRSDQLAMWQEIRRRHDAMRVTSRTGNLSDVADRESGRSACAAASRRRRIGHRGRDRRQGRIAGCLRQAHDPPKGLESPDLGDRLGFVGNPATRDAEQVKRTYWVSCIWCGGWTSGRVRRSVWAKPIDSEVPMAVWEMPSLWMASQSISASRSQHDGIALTELNCML